MANPAKRVPRPLAGVDLKRLPLSPLEGFVLSRVDGVASIAVLCDLTSLDEEQVTKIVGRLIELGAVEWAREWVSLPRATGRPPRMTPSNAVIVPPSLRSPPPPSPMGAAKLRVPRPSQSEVKPPEYVGHGVAEDARGPDRVVVSPRASHTGARTPAGELDEDIGTADTVPPPPGVEEEPADAALGPADPKAEAADISAPEPEALLTSRSPTSPGGRAQQEEVDLDPARRQRVDELYVALDLLDHYEVLGIGRDASRGDVRTAYFALSKVFHPDTMFRKRLGAYKAKMEAIFKRLTEAYDVLGKTKARKEYDHYLKLQDRTRAVEALLEGSDEASELRRRAAEVVADEVVADTSGAAPELPLVEAPVEPAAPEPDAEPVAPSPSQRTMSEAAKRNARELFARRLRGPAHQPEAKRPEPSPPPVAPSAPVGKDRAFRDLASSLRGAAGITGGLDPVTRHARHAERAEGAGDLAEAARLWRLAMALAPERLDLVAEHARVNAMLASSLAGAYEEQALYEQSQDKWAAAAVSWAKVFEGRPTDARAARQSAEALLVAKGDLHRAKELANKAVELEPESVPGLVTLARVYIAAGLALNARRILLRAVKLDPKDEMVENLLRGLGG